MSPYRWVNVMRSYHNDPAATAAAIVDGWFHTGRRTTETEIIEHVRERLASYKYPRSVEFRDALVATATDPAIAFAFDAPASRSGGSKSGMRGSGDRRRRPG